MLRKTSVMLAIVVAGLFLFVQGTALAEPAVLTGTVIDNACASSHQADLASFIKTHTKECALMPGCEASGYLLYSGGKLYKFDNEGSAKIAEFLKGKDAKLDVTVKAEVSGDMLKLVSVENQ